MTHRIPIQVRFYDTDALGHINNAAYAHWAELGRLEFLRDFEVPVDNLIVVHLSLDFKRQIEFGEHVEIETGVDRVGTTSVRLAQRVLAGDEVAAEIGSVVVYFDYEAGRAVPIPEAMRAKLELRPDR